jgi:hypothetical protein
MGGEPRSKLDIIYQEVLGEVGVVVKRLELVSAQLDRILTTRPVDRMAEALQNAALMASGRLRIDLDRATGNASKSLNAAAAEAAMAVHALKEERRGVFVERTALAFCAALLGGVVAAFLARLL